MRMRSYHARKGSAKYSNKKVVIDGVKFDSIAESKYYSVAKHYANKNELELRMQESFVLLPTHKRNGKTVRSISYKPDFTFWDGDKLVKVVDVKGWNAVAKLGGVIQHLTHANKSHNFSPQGH